MAAKAHCAGGKWQRGTKMTVSELYKWAIKNGIEDYKIEVQFRDAGGDYIGTDGDLFLLVDSDKKSVIV